MAYIYALIDPHTSQIRYIGKANNLDTRLKSHLGSPRKQTTPVCMWMRKLKRDGLIPEMRLLAETDDWENEERKWIKMCRLFGVELLNVAEGGNEPMLPKNQRVLDILKRKRYLGGELKRGRGSNQTRSKLRDLARRHPKLFKNWVNLPDR